MVEEFKLSEEDKIEIVNPFNNFVVADKTFFEEKHQNDYVEIELDGNKIQVTNFTQLDIYLDTVCNANCPFCINKAKKAEIKDALYKDRMPFADFLKRFDDVYAQLSHQLDLKPFIMLTGGEPTISPRFVPFIQHLLSKKIRFDLLTNSTNLQGMVGFKPLLEIMAQNCGGMQISRAHYDDDKNQQLMNLSVKPTNEDLFKSIKTIHETFTSPYHIGLSCMMLKDGINSIEEIKKYIEFYKSNNLNVIVFRQMENTSEYTGDKEGIEKIIVRFEDIKEQLEKDPDFEGIDAVDMNGYCNYNYKYKGLNSTVICFSIPGSMRKRYTESDKIDQFTLNPDGKLYYNYFYSVPVKHL